MSVNEANQVGRRDAVTFFRDYGAKTFWIDPRGKLHINLGGEHADWLRSNGYYTELKGRDVFVVVAAALSDGWIRGVVAGRDLNVETARPLSSKRIYNIAWDASQAYGVREPKRAFVDMHRDDGSIKHQEIDLNESTFRKIVDQVLEAQFPNHGSVLVGSKRVSRMDAEEFIWNVQERWHYIPKVFDVLDDYDVDRRDDLEKLTVDDLEDLLMALADVVRAFPSSWYVDWPATNEWDKNQTR